MNVYSSDDRVMFTVWGTLFCKDDLPGRRTEQFIVVLKMIKSQLAVIAIWGIYRW